ncbi:MAG TPA: ABC transporter ATP-binding protein [Rhizomicrobium sp.]|jgi:lipoprotein-releasing system ATP-binding protein|nr:ABC transporter ATP-binding protein [Rhizomicrobium sp.]
MSDALANAALRLDRVARIYAEGAGTTLEVFKNVSLTLRPGEIVALVGQSGAGKSSLLHMAGLLEAPSGGDVLIDGEAASSLSEGERTRIRRDTIGFVYQAHHLLPEFSALENVMLPQLIAGKSKAVAETEAKRLLELMGLSQRLTHRPAQLSGGEQQRVAIARGLANHPRVLLADEPTGNLDPRTAAAVFDLLVSVVRKEGSAALIATHNLELAAKMDRALVLHDGKLVDGGKLGRNT